MTTLAGYQGNGWSVIGADTRVVDAGTIFELPKNAGKIFRKNSYVFGVAGDFRVAQLLQHAVELPKPSGINTQDAADKFMTAEVIPMWRAEYQELGYEVDKDIGSVVLVSVNTFVYAIDESWTWARDKRGIYAGGSGQSYAFGAMSAYEFPKNVAEATVRLKAAIKIASQYDNNTSEPSIIISQESK